MGILDRVMAKLSGGGAKAAAEADRLALKKLLAGISKKEGPHGDPFLELGDGLVLRQTATGHDALSGAMMDKWEPWEVGGLMPLGHFKAMSRAGEPATMLGAGVRPSQQRKGVATKAYRALADHYGSLQSDPFMTTAEARGVYRKLGARLTDQTNHGGDFRYLLEGRDKGPRFGFFGED